MFEYLIFIFIGAVLFLVADITRKSGFDRLTIDRYINKNKLNINEEFTITTVVENKKRLSISYLNLKQALPSNVILSKSFEGEDLYKFKIGKNQRIKRSVKGKISKRGVYLFDGIEASVGDMFGFSFNTKKFDNYNEVIVYPKLVAIENFKVKNLGSLGDRVIRRWLAEDNLYIKGIRDYSVNDRMKDINWKASSRMSKLMVNEYDSTSNMKLSIILNVQCGEPYWKNIKPELIEKAIEMSISLTKSSIKFGVETGFYTNAMLTGMSSREFKGVLPSLKSFEIVAEICARIGYDINGDLDVYFKKNRNIFDRNTVYVLITCFMNDNIKSQISAMRRLGINLKIIDVSCDDGVYYER
jgi:uncharacterized protein (DUF58 family)